MSVESEKNFLIHFNINRKFKISLNFTYFLFIYIYYIRNERKTINIVIIMMYNK